LAAPEQVEQAAAEQPGSGKRLGSLLMDKGLLSDRQVAEALARSLGLPLVDCSALDIPPEAILLLPKSLAKRKLILPVKLHHHALLLALADPTDLATIDEVAFRTGCRVEAAVCCESSLLAAIEKPYGPHDALYGLLETMPSEGDVEFVRTPEKDLSDESVQSLYKRSEAPPIVKLVTMIVLDAVKLRASDIHLEPQEECTQVRHRVDGDLRNILRYPSQIHAAVTSRIKIISSLNIINRQTLQDGRSAVRLEGRDIDLRVATLPSIHGENIVIRLLDQRAGLIPLKKLGVPDDILGPLMDLASQPQGMLLVTGPMGSGKATTLYSLLMKLRSEAGSIFTIENPIEYHLPGITQVGVNEAVNLTFASALRSILRQDPDIILVGEIRDLETAEIAVRSALTGHLVLSTVHTNSAVATITRLLDIGPDAYLVSSAVTAALAQRLVRRICLDCREAVAAPEAVGKQGLPRRLKAYCRGRGCQACQQRGY
jgi:type IV pilus assembly protein PilB